MTTQTTYTVPSFYFKASLTIGNVFSGKSGGNGGGVLSEKPAEKCEKRWAFQTDPGERRRDEERSNHKYYSHTINGGLPHDPLTIPGLKIPR